MEPLLVSEHCRHRTALTDLAVELASRAAGFRHSLPRGVMGALADLVRAMNCYYSNLIEGHDTHPVDIERALKNYYSAEPAKRNLQREAAAQFAVQAWIDAGGLTGRATTAAGLTEIHRRFGDLLPPERLIATDPDAGKQTEIAPGALRERDVKVGRHVAISPGALPRFLAHFAGENGV
jgi:Fic family protein